LSGRHGSLSARHLAKQTRTHARTHKHTPTSSPHSKSAIANVRHVMSHVYTYQPRPISPSHPTHPLSLPPHSRQSSLNDLTGTGGPDAPNRPNRLRSRSAPHLTPAHMPYFTKKKSSLVPPSHLSSLASSLDLSPLFPRLFLGPLTSLLSPLYPILSCPTIFSSML
jgi:hypothetical protein